MHTVDKMMVVQQRTSRHTLTHSDAHRRIHIHRDISTIWRSWTCGSNSWQQTTTPTGTHRYPLCPLPWYMPCLSQHVQPPPCNIDIITFISNAWLYAVCEWTPDSYGNICTTYGYSNWRLPLAPGWVEWSITLFWPVWVCLPVWVYFINTSVLCQRRLLEWHSTGSAGTLRPDEKAFICGLVKKQLYVTVCGLYVNWWNPSRITETSTLVCVMSF